MLYNKSFIFLILFFTLGYYGANAQKTDSLAIFPGQGLSKSDSSGIAGASHAKKRKHRRKTSAKNISANMETVSVKAGETATISLNDNSGSTGYRQFFKTDDERVAQTRKGELIMPEKSVPGAAAVQNYIVKGLKKGETNVRFYATPPGTGRADVLIKSYHVKVL